MFKWNNVGQSISQDAIDLKVTGKKKQYGFFLSIHVYYMDVSENSGTQEWMVYNGKPY